VNPRVPHPARNKIPKSESSKSSLPKKWAYTQKNTMTKWSSEKCDPTRTQKMKKERGKNLLTKGPSKKMLVEMC